eukprot:GHVU01031915.1.p1 GENE.GHVU01031915.1~~GHVU01031915.1.p1  ORF type:complete len:508 (-),score=70.55 GHVU01031915.1:968-2371(-)
MAEASFEAACDFIKQATSDGVRLAVGLDIWSQDEISLLAEAAYGIVLTEDEKYEIREVVVAMAPFGDVSHTAEAIKDKAFEGLAKHGLHPCEGRSCNWAESSGGGDSHAPEVSIDGNDADEDELGGGELLDLDVDLGCETQSEGDFEFADNLSDVSDADFPGAVDSDTEDEEQAEVTPQVEPEETGRGRGRGRGLAVEDGDMRRGSAVATDATEVGTDRVFSDEFPKVLTMQTDRGANVVAAFVNVPITNCVGHKIHRTVQTKLTKKKGSYFEPAFAKMKKLATLFRRAPKCYRLFRKLQKLHRIERITKSPQFIETRWTAAFDLLEWSVRNKQPVQSFASNPIPGKRTIAKEKALRAAIDLDCAEWDALALLKRILSPLSQMTRSIQATATPAGHLIMPMLRGAIDDLEAAQKQIVADASLGQLAKDAATANIPAVIDDLCQRMQMDPCKFIFCLCFSRKTVLCGC